MCSYNQFEYFLVCKGLMSNPYGNRNRFFSVSLYAFHSDKVRLCVLAQFEYSMLLIYRQLRNGNIGSRHFDVCGGSTYMKLQV